MKNSLKRGILNGLAALAIASCAADTGKAVNSEPDFKDKYNISYHANAEGFEARKSRLLTGNSLLEAKINDSLNGMVNRGSGNAKLSTAVENFGYDEFTGDLDLDHDVDFDDFFLLADDFGNPYDFDHFFKLADNFGKTVNRSPLVHELTSSNGDKADVADEVVFNANATDPENDAINYNWSVNGNPAETNGREFRWKAGSEGKYEISVKASDIPYNSESPALMKTVIIEQAAPVLSFPSEINFDQYIEGQDNGNVHRLNLDDYVENENEVDLSFEVLDNEFEHTSENTAPFNLRLYRPYTATALHLEQDGNVLVINPVANYNANDHGIRKLVIEAKDKLTEKAGTDTVNVNVVRVPESKDISELLGFNNHYNNVTTGEGFKVSPKEFYIWTGNIRSIDGEWFFNDDLKGPVTTQTQIEYFEKLAETIISFDKFFSPIEVKYTNNREDYLRLYNNRNSDNPVIFCIGSNYDNSTGSRKDENGTYSLVEIEIKPEKRFNTYLHEGTHAVGFDHPGIPFSEEQETTVFSSGSELMDVPAKDLATIKGFYETKKY